MASDDDNFDLNATFSAVPLNEETVKKDSKVKKRAEKRAKEDREKQREINREKRKAKKELKEKNKKRKRGEIPISDSEETPAKDDSEDEDGEQTKKKKEFGVWVGNFNFQTAPEDMRKYFRRCGTVVRLVCPRGAAGNKNKGFAYVFFAKRREAEKALALNERTLEGRSLLIKAADDFNKQEGSKPKSSSSPQQEQQSDTNSAPTGPAVKPVRQKNPPCPTLFLGNLPFTATADMIREQFESMGDIRKVRVATFEDSGKCKGFGYIDFGDLDSAVRAIRAPDKHILDGRKIRVEYASEEAHNRGRPRKVKEREAAAAAAAAAEANGPASESQDQSNHTEEASQSERYEQRPKRRAQDGSDAPWEKRRKSNKDQGRAKPGRALSEAQRQKPTVQEFKGTKITFDNDD